MSSQNYDKFRVSLDRLSTDERVQENLREYLAPVLEDLAGTHRELRRLNWDDRIEVLWQFVAVDNFACWQRLGRSGSVCKFAIDIVTQGLRKIRHDCQQVDWLQSLDGTTDRDTWIFVLLSCGLSAKQVVNLVQSSLVLRDYPRQRQLRFRRPLDIREFVNLIRGHANLPANLAEKAEYVRKRIGKMNLDELGFARFILALEKPIVSESQVYQIKHRTKAKMTTGDLPLRQNFRLTNE